MLQPFVRSLAMVACFTGLLVGTAPERSVAQTTDSPEAARIVTEDIDRFWTVLRGAAAGDTARALQEEYIDAGSVGVRDFVQGRIISGTALARMIAERPERYAADVQQRSGRVAEFERGIRAAFYALEYLYPPAEFPSVYFVVGRLNSGGTASSNGLLIGLEMYAHSDEMMARLPLIVAHESIHFQQSYRGTRTLLAQSILEGSADFISELMTGRHINEDIHEFADPREAEIWERFEEVMHEPLGDATAGWLYGGSIYPDGPADLAYYVGYKITEAYYEQAENKRRAIYDILNATDFESLLARSGYAPDESG